MVKKTLRLLGKEFERINEAALLLGLFTLGSQILAILRERLLASSIGPSETLDIYFAAFRIPDILFALVAALVSVTILMPFFIDKLQGSDDGHKEAHQYMSHIFSSFLLFLVVLSLILYFIMPWIVHLIAPGFSDTALAELTKISRVMLLSPILLGISNLFTTITQAFKQFVAYAISPLLYNLGIILGVIFLYPIMGVMGLAYGVVFGALLHMAIQLPIIIKRGFLPFFTWFINWRDVWMTMKVSVPRTLTLALSQITLAVLVSIASTIGEGSISIFTLAKNIQSVPLALIGVSFSVAAFPTLVQYFSQNNKDKFIEYIVGPARQIIFWSFPVIALFIVERAQIVRVVLGAGEFTWNDTRLTAAALALFVISIFAQSLTLLLVRGYYAAGETWRPFRANVIGTVVSIVAAYVLLFWAMNEPTFLFFFESLFRVNGVRQTELLMLPLAYSIGSIVSLLVMWNWFKREFIPNVSSLNRTLIHSFSSSVIMGTTAYFMLRLSAFWVDQSTTWGIFMQGLISGVVALVLGGFLLYVLKNPEFFAILKALRSRFWKGTRNLPAMDSTE